MSERSNSRRRSGGSDSICSKAFVRDARQRLDVDAEGLWVVRGEQAEGVGQGGGRRLGG